MKCINNNDLSTYIYLGTCDNTKRELMHLVKIWDNKKICQENTIVLTDEEFKQNYFMED